MVGLDGAERERERETHYFIQCFIGYTLNSLYSAKAYPLAAHG
jgi:hypothetical protein